ncbi:hypothetical protein V8G54_002102, partial [Vigna mungo]
KLSPFASTKPAPISPAPSPSLASISTSSTPTTPTSRLSVHEVIAIVVHAKPFPIDHRNGIYLILTTKDVTMEDFCCAVYGFHYFTFPSKVGCTLLYAWVGNSDNHAFYIIIYVL